MEVMVSICCATFNQEKYISRALESFTAQDTNFAYEILIHDDASTDKTAEAINEYKKAYPNIIKPVYQKVNQYSQGVSVVDEFLIPKAEGKYIAECEGDDFWTDSSKLQRQFDFMETHPDCSLSMHGAMRVKASDEKEVEPLIAASTSRYFSTDEIIEKDNVFSTNSMFYLKKHVLNVPEFIYDAPVGDYPLTIWLSLKGDVYYFEDIMSAYRVLVENSWTHNLMKTPESLKDHFSKMESWLYKLNVYTEYKYIEVINKQILKNRFNLNRALYDLKGVKTEELKFFYKKLSIVEKAKLNIGYYIPASLKVSQFIRQNKIG
ncbi:glycosyltransferase [Alkalibacterium sp. 20]|uniref:glycosyltransferase family 2 protein n=1 Tax=Alkalibacterium sp. 20 TaxID=1798803 RepID=UPI0008FFE9EF|nr:glycosyltransferase [Alkalibacterium sp. 20]OJF94203.1 hypothetical protein AX762_07795 [Alkalibacterium sp. 20]